MHALALDGRPPRRTERRSPRRPAEAAPSYAQAAARRAAPAAPALGGGGGARGDAPPAAGAGADAAAPPGAAGEHRLRFALGGAPLPQSATIFQAIQSAQHRRPAVAGGDAAGAPAQPHARRLWDEVHTVHYSRCARARAAPSAVFARAVRQRNGSELCRCRRQV